MVHLFITSRPRQPGARTPTTKLRLRWCAMHFLNYAYGNNGYNKKVKELMKFCGFDRKVKTYNETLRTSAAVHRYTMMEPADRFALMNVAFGQEDFRVDENLEILG